jgi:hypothetical protein
MNVHSLRTVLFYAMHSGLHPLMNAIINIAKESGVAIELLDWLEKEHTSPLHVAAVKSTLSGKSGWKTRFPLGRTRQENSNNPKNTKTFLNIVFRLMTFSHRNRTKSNALA